MSRPEFEDLPFYERPDLTPYLIHLTKSTADEGGRSAFDNLVSILATGTIWGTISQHTEGSCSPTIADAKGNVSIICNGVDQATANKLINLLNELLKDRYKLDQIQQDLDKTAKRTDQIEARQASRRLAQSQSEQLVKLLAGKTLNASENFSTNEQR